MKQYFEDYNKNKQDLIRYASIVLLRFLEVRYNQINR